MEKERRKGRSRVGSKPAWHCPCKQPPRRREQWLQPMCWCRYSCSSPACSAQLHLLLAVHISSEVEQKGSASPFSGCSPSPWPEPLDKGKLKFFILPLPLGIAREPPVSDGCSIPHLSGSLRMRVRFTFPAQLGQGLQHGCRSIQPCSLHQGPDAETVLGFDIGLFPPLFSPPSVHQRH